MILIGNQNTKGPEGTQNETHPKNSFSRQTRSLQRKCSLSLIRKRHYSHPHEKLRRYISKHRNWLYRRRSYPYRKLYRRLCLRKLRFAIQVETPHCGRSDSSNRTRFVCHSWKQNPRSKTSAQPPSRSCPVQSIFQSTPRHRKRSFF